jgi:hypothetical protein
LGKILIDLMFPCTMFTLQTSFKRLLLGGGGGGMGGKSVRRGKLWRLCLNCVHEFGLGFKTICCKCVRNVQYNNKDWSKEPYLISLKSLYYTEVLRRSKGAGTVAWITCCTTLHPATSESPISLLRVWSHHRVSRQSAKPFLKSSGLGLPQPLTHRRVCSPTPLVPPGSGGRGTLAGDRRVPILTRGHTLWYSLYIRTLWVTLTKQAVFNSALLTNVAFYMD